MENDDERIIRELREWYSEQSRVDTEELLKKLEENPNEELQDLVLENMGKDFEELEKEMLGDAPETAEEDNEIVESTGVQDEGPDTESDHAEPETAVGENVQPEASVPVEPVQNSIEHEPIDVIPEFSVLEAELFGTEPALEAEPEEEVEAEGH